MLSVGSSRSPWGYVAEHHSVSGLILSLCGTSEAGSIQTATNSVRLFAFAALKLMFSTLLQTGSEMAEASQVVIGCLIMIGVRLVIHIFQCLPACPRVCELALHAILLVTGLTVASIQLAQGDSHLRHEAAQNFGICWVCGHIIEIFQLRLIHCLRFQLCRE
jgi:hypothetical protein